MRCSKENQNRQKPAITRCIALIISAILIISLCACSESGGGQSAPADDLVTVTDHAGRTVEVPQPAERIVSGYYISSSVCIALGLAGRMAGIEARAGTRPIYALAAPQLLELPSVGTAKDFNLEACLALDPGLVILPIRLQETADTLAGMGIPVILVNPESHEDVIDMISIIGAAAGAGGRAGQLIGWYEDMHDDIKSRAAILSQKPDVYISGTGSWLTTAPGDMFQSYLAEVAGGNNVAGDIKSGGWAEVSYEQLLAMNPDVIIIPSEAEYGIEDITADAQLAELTAVREGRIFKMPSDYEAWDSPIPAAMLGAKWLLNILHEDIDVTDELQQDTGSFYNEFYFG